MNKATGVGGILAVTAVACMLPALAANPSGSAPAGKKDAAVTLQPIPGSPAKRVILTAKAAERLGIETAQIGEQAVAHKQVVGGLIVPGMENQPKPTSPRGFGGFAQAVPGPESSSPQGTAPSSGSRAAALPTATGGFSGFTPGKAAEPTSGGGSKPKRLPSRRSSQAPPSRASWRRPRILHPSAHPLRHLASRGCS